MSGLVISRTEAYLHADAYNRIALLLFCSIRPNGLG